MSGGITIELEDPGITIVQQDMGIEIDAEIGGAEEGMTLEMDGVPVRGLKGDKGDQGLQGVPGDGATDPGDLTLIFDNHLI